jgi:hypothetical protein
MLAVDLAGDREILVPVSQVDLLAEIQSGVQLGVAVGVLVEM